MGYGMWAVHSAYQSGRAGFRKLKQYGITPELLDEPGRTALQFALDYANDYADDYPSLDLLRQETGIELDAGDANVDFYSRRVMREHQARLLQVGIAEVQALAALGKQQEAVAKLTEVTRSVRAAGDVALDIEPFYSGGDADKEYYERLESGVRGILTPWDAVNDMTLGFWPEDLVLFVARSGVGKTWSALLLAQCAARQVRRGTERKNRVLFVSTEMSKQRLRFRSYAMEGKQPYYEVSHGALSAFGKTKFFDTIDSLQAQENIAVVGGQFDYKVEGVERAIDSFEPDLVVVDGVYLLRTQGANRIERMANVFDEMKRMAKRMGVPIVITTQFNREVKNSQTSTVQLESIAMSDAGSWNADLVFGMVQTDDMKTNKQMMIKALKVREGFGREVMVNWNFETMNFSELTAVGGGGGDSDEFGGRTEPDESLPF